MIPSNEILNLIDSQKRDIIRLTGKNPKSIYLGDEEWYTLRSIASGKCLYNCDASYCTYDGMNIYRVLANTHLRVL